MLASGSTVGPNPDNQGHMGSYHGIEGNITRSFDAQQAQVDSANRSFPGSTQPTATRATRLSKPTQKAQPAAPSPTPKQARPASTSKAKDSGDVEGRPAAKKVRVLAPKAGEGSSSTAKATVGAKQVKDGSKKAGKAGRKTASEVGGIMKKEELIEEIPSTKKKKVKAPGTTKPRGTQSLVAGQPKWTVPKNLLTAFDKMEVSSSHIPVSEIRPAIWASSKEELLSTLPELTKATNGISWLMAQASVLIFEERNVGLNVSNVRFDGTPSMELTMTRDFVCSTSDLAASLANLQGVNGPRLLSMDSPIATGGEASTYGIPMDAPKRSNLSLRLPPSPRKTKEGVYVVYSVKTNRPITTKFNLDSLITMPPEPNDEGDMIMGNSVPVYQAPAVSHNHDAHSSNIDSGCPGSYPTFPSDTHPDHRMYSLERSDPRVPASSFLKRGPDFPTQLEEIPSKRIKLEQMTTSLSASKDPGFLSERLPQVSLPLQNQNMHQISLRRPTQCPSGTGSSSQDVSMPLSNSTSPQNVAISRPLTMTPRPHISSSLPTSARSSLQTFKSLPTGLKFSKVKAEAQGASVQGKGGCSVPKPSITPLPDLPFGKPVHQRNVIAKDETQESSISKLPSNKPDRHIPSTLPPEVQVLLDAYVSGRPIVAIASHAVLLDHWAISLPPELAYAFLGFFRVRRVWENEVAGSPSIGSSTTDHVTGHVEWRFRCEWAASAEEYAASEPDVPEAWWARNRGKGKGRAMSGDNEETDTESSIFYRMFRAAHPNYKYRGTPVGQSYQSVLPRHVRAPDKPGLPDELFPLGWHCANCGKLNYRSMLRHRTCSSSFCKDKPSPNSYALPLWTLRERQQGTPVPQPYDTYPKGVDARFTLWGDDMRTYTYVISGDVDESITVKHIFTCNDEELQGEANKLLHAFQLDVPMQRKIGKATRPYFEFEFTSESTSRVLSSAPTTVWENAPPCVVHAKEYLAYCGRGYGEKRSFVVNTLSVLAWITSGTRKGASILHCKVNSIIMMCLGADTVISVIPKSGFLNSVGPSAVDSGNSMLVDEAAVPGPKIILVDGDDQIPGDDMDVEPDTAPGTLMLVQAAAELPDSALSTIEDVVILDPNQNDDNQILGDDMDVEPDTTWGAQPSARAAANPKPTTLTTEDAVVPDPNPVAMNEDNTIPMDDMDMEPDTVSSAPAPARAPAKPPKPAIIMTLVHGDLLVLSGDDFEYSIKRSGTSILLIGS